MAEVINTGFFDTGEAEVAVNTGSDVSDEERIAGLGDEEFFRTTLWALFHIVKYGSLNSFIDRHDSGFVRFVGANFNLVGFKIGIGDFEIGNFGNTHTGLKQKLDDSCDTGVTFAGVTKSPVLQFGEDPGWFYVILRVSDLSGGVFGDSALILQESKKGFDRVNFSGNGFGGEVTGVQIFLEFIDIVFNDHLRGGFAGKFDELNQLFNVFGVS